MMIYSRMVKRNNYDLNWGENLKESSVWRL